MKKNQIFIKCGTEYKEMTKELLEACNLAGEIEKKFEKCGASKQARREGRPTDNKHAAYSVARVEQNFVFLTLLYSKTEKTRRDA